MYRADERYMKECSKALNVLYVHDRTYEPYLVHWMFPLQICYEEDLGASEYTYMPQTVVFGVSEYTCMSQTLDRTSEYTYMPQTAAFDVSEYTCMSQTAAFGVSEYTCMSHRIYFRSSEYMYTY